MSVIGMTMCSGIGAPELAAPWADWRMASEIEKFPRAVLAERFGYRAPEDHNQGEPLLWGDMTEITPGLLRARGVPLPDLIVAGTPCQAFSVAGLRQGTEDARGNLTLKFVEILHELVASRPDGKLAVLWENVPGVLSDKGNAFGCFLGGLVGAVDALRPPADGIWPGEGMVQGARARAAWAILDAQYFGVAQRRRRVFVVIDFGNRIDPAAVLLEPDRLRGDHPTRGEAGERVATLTSNGVGTCGADDNQGRAGHLITSTGHLAHCLNAGGMGRQDYETETLITHDLRGEGLNTPESTPPAVAYAIQERTVPQAVEFAENSLAELRLCGGDGDISAQLTTGGGKPGQGQPCIAGSTPPWSVRRLMPVECERLQGMPDGHTAVAYRGKPASDGPRYKAIGNSMAVPVVRWIMDRMRISMEEHR